MLCGLDAVCLIRGCCKLSFKCVGNICLFVCVCVLQSEMLLQHQSNPCISDTAGKTPLDLACEFGRVGVSTIITTTGFKTEDFLYPINNMFYLKMIIDEDEVK